MQICQTRPYSVRLYYRALSGETQARRIAQIPVTFTGVSGAQIVQLSQGDGTGIVQLHRKIDTVPVNLKGLTVAYDRVRSKATRSRKNISTPAYYTLISPEIYMRNEEYYLYEDDGVLWIVPVSVRDAWIRSIPGGAA